MHTVEMARWADLHQKQKEQEKLLREIEAEKRSLRGTIFTQLRVWGLSDEAMLREIQHRSIAA